MAITLCHALCPHYTFIVMKILRLPDLRLRKPYTVLPHPNAIDQWLSGNNINSYGSMGDIQSDHVSCMVQLVITPVRSLPGLRTNQSNYLFQKYRENFYRYNLSLYVEVPELAGIDIAHLSSPIVTLGRYEGHHLDVDAPEWTRIASGTTFEIRQPCGSMADVFTEIAFWPENADIV